MRRTLSEQLALARGGEITRDESRVEEFLKELQEYDTDGNQFLFSNPGQVEFCDELGRGAYGAVWKGFLHLDSSKDPLPVAIKVLFDINEGIVAIRNQVDVIRKPIR